MQPDNNELPVKTIGVHQVSQLLKRLKKFALCPGISRLDFNARAVIPVDSLIQVPEIHPCKAP